MELYSTSRPAIGVECATCEMTLNAAKFGTSHASPLATYLVAPLVILAKFRRSSANVPITNSENANTADINGVENVEKKIAIAVIRKNSSTMKYRATSRYTSARSK